jgi:hypothetical protein
MKKIIFSALLLTLTLSQALASGFGNFPLYGDQHWKSPVVNAAALPLTGNSIGDVRTELTTFAIYIWNGAAWQFGLPPKAVNGPATSTDKALVRWNGVNGDTVQDSVATLSNAGLLSVPNEILSGLTASTVPYLDASKQFQSSAVTPTELGYVSGVTSAIQTQLNGKQASGNYITGTTGDVVSTGPGSVPATIANSAVTNAKMANMASNTIKGNNTGGAAAPSDLSVAQVNTLLGTISSIGAFDGQAAAANGLSTSGGSLFAQSADATHPGMVNTGAQTFAGAKTFSSTIVGSVNGNAGTATALAANPTDCGANTFANAIDAGANLSCISIPNAATTATSANTNSTIVARDGSGNFSAGTITANLTGTASGNATITPTNHGVVISGAANAMTAAATGTAGQVMTSNGAASDPTMQNLPYLNFYYTNGAGTSVANSGSTTLSFGNRTYDQNSLNGSFVFDGTSTFTAPFAGKYDCKCQAKFSSATYAGGNEIILSLNKNGSQWSVVDYLQVQVSQNSTYIVGGSDVISMAATNTATCSVQNNRTAGATTLDGTTINNYFHCSYVGP